ncbi:MAG: bifunctional O-acetylhomoserine aminocarboxypropyltransferase/cysteine synthase, partial [Candidatus Marinimicrobia bacterium]|nr:bifunctional O-acetylhomoserine aminocarboxypropyltransferase/cysteine synthase [Candidatus Neomarinimicrobiota bacterium]
PVQTSHSLLSDDELEFAGIDKALIRLSVGIEAVDDLIDDMSQALDAI